MKTRVLVAGGCHVTGYPIGERHAFVGVMRKLLSNWGIDAQTESLSYLPAHHLDRLMDAAKKFQPQVTVLQLGNFETTVTFRQYFREKLGWKKAKATPGRIRLAADRVFHPTASWRWKCRAKLWLDARLGHSLVDMASVRRASAALLDALVESGCRDVVVLAPLPCADPLYMLYRDELATVLEQLAAERGLLYLPFHSEDNNGSWFVDATHLNRFGQEHLGRTVARAIRELVQDHEEPELYAASVGSAHADSFQLRGN